MSDIAICVQNLSKCYEIYDAPRDRLKQFIWPRLQGLAGRPSKQYFQEFWALKDVSFEIKKGETVGIIGRNGSGKSTLLQMICGTLNPTSGSIHIAGRIAALLELGSGFNPEFTGRENVYMNAAVLGLSQEQIEDRFEEITTFADIGQFIEQAVKTYSSGMLVRLAFAVAINVEPDILIIDEALSVGDELFQRKCFSRIESIRRNGTTILFVSHSAGQVTELCDRVVLMDAGEKLAMGSPKKIVGCYQKLLYAPVDKHEFIRAQIRKIDENFENSVIYTKDTTFQVDLSTEPVEELQETFDPNLKSSTTIEYESLGPLIGEPQILTLVGEKVNGLVRGREYRFFYDVFFTQSAKNVRFAMLIKTTSGFSLGGALSAPSISKSISFIAAGSKISVDFKFTCYLNTGVYFLNAGVFGLHNAVDTVLHRKADVIAFRVLPVEFNTVTELIDFGFKSTIYLNE